MHISRKYMIAVLFMVGMPLMAQKQKTSRIDQSLTIYNDVMRQLDINYVDTLNYDDLTETAINAMLRKIDPYTVYYPKKKDDDLRMMTTGKYGGIGSIIQQRETKNKRGEKEWQIIIANPYEGKPAQRNGVQAGDRILSVDGISTKGQTVSEVSNNLRGVPGSEVTLLLERDGVEKPFTVSFAREDIHIDPLHTIALLRQIRFPRRWDISAFRSLQPTPPASLQWFWTISTTTKVSVHSSLTCAAT